MSELDVGAFIRVEHRASVPLGRGHVVLDVLEGPRTLELGVGSRSPGAGRRRAPFVSGVL